MTESQNLGTPSQTSDKIRSITDGAKVVGGLVDVVVAAADGGLKVELGRPGGGGEVMKRKRGRPPKAQGKPPPAKKNKEKEKQEEEDVCFICFDGGSLVLCDRRGCPKAYHPACIKRDEAFFESAAKWNCGWHICSICQKTAHHMCYTCTYSLCRSCIKRADYVCVRGDKGFCTICMKTIMLIENNGQGEDGKVQADFDDKLSWEYLFKVYWIYLKGKLSLTLEELTQAKNPWKLATTTTISSSLPSTGVNVNGNVNVNNNDNKITDVRSITSTSASSVDNVDANESKRRKIDEQIDIKETVNTNESKVKNDESVCVTTVELKEEWASKELLDFVSHMKNGDISMLSRFDVQALMLEYITRNNLRDPKRKNQIVCDSMLKALFGKPRVGHIQMWKLLEHHFVDKDNSDKDKENTRKRKVVKSSRVVHDDDEWSPENMTVVGKNRKLKNPSKGEGRALQNKLEESAAVDVHNMSLIYLRRDLIEKLLEDSENFHGKVVGSIVRIRISGEHDMYRLVQVVGTSKVDVAYKVHTISTDVMLEVLNLDKKETISIESISDQDFSEEECRRLQQSIKCGLVNHFTVGEIQEKAVDLQSVKLNDSMEKEILRLNHVRDVASEKGHKKNYKECMEKLQILKTPDERERRLQEIPEVHSDPKMNPHYESDDTEEYFNKEHDDHKELKYGVVSTKKPCSPTKRAATSNDGAGRKMEQQQPSKNPNIEEKETTPHKKQHVEEEDVPASTLGKPQNEIDCNVSTVMKVDQQATPSESNTAQEIIAMSSPNDVVWHYLDPSGQVQGPFSLVQLQRWSTTGYFPVDMRIWATHEKEKPLLLHDVLKEKFPDSDDKVGNQTEGAVPSSSTMAPNPEKVSSSGQSFGQNWSVNINCNPVSSDSTVVPRNKDDDPTPVFDIPKTIIHGMGEMIEFSTLAEESVSDLLAEVDAMESQYGLPSPTSRRNSFVDDLFNDEFSPMPDQGTTGSDGFSSSGDIQLPCATTTDERLVGSSQVNTFDFMKTSFISPEIDVQTVMPPRVNHSENMGFKWPQMQQGMIDINTSAKAEGDDADMEIKTSDVQVKVKLEKENENGNHNHNRNHNHVQPVVGELKLSAMLAPKTNHTTSGDVPAKEEEEDGEFVKPKPPQPQPQPLPPLTLGLDPFDPQTMQPKPNHSGRSSRTGNIGWDPTPTPTPNPIPDQIQNQQKHNNSSYSPRARSHQVANPNPNPNQQKHNNSSNSPRVRSHQVANPNPNPSQQRHNSSYSPRGRSHQVANPNPNQNQQRHNNSSNSPRGRSHQVDESGFSRNTRSQSNNKHSSLGGGGYSSRPPSKGGQRVCRFYESGRCKKGASCKYLHP